jgi:amino acid adenylation domain-containing protein
MTELTAMQAAYWVGRQAAGPLGGVSAHLYAEFDGCGLDRERLRSAVRALFQGHDMLRLAVGADGLQTVQPLDARHGLVVEDLRHLEGAALADALAAKRTAKTHQHLDLEGGRSVDLGLSLLPGGRSRLHVDLDMIAGDPSSFRVLMEDLARFYAEPPPAERAPLSYFDYLARRRGDSATARRRDQDRCWWQARLAHMPPAPSLPWRADRDSAPVRSERFAARLETKDYRALEGAARRHGLTLTTLMLALFALDLGAHTGSRRFRLTVPMFHRPRCAKGVDRLLGDFSEVLIVGVDLDVGRSLLDLCRGIAGELAEVLSHATYSGVAVLRDLSRRQGGMQLAPVVFTSGMNMPGGELFSERVVRTFGEMTWVISQAPQVALDAQVARVHGGILINWDVRLDALPETWVRSLFDDYLASARAVAADPDRLTAPLDRAFPGRHAPHPAAAEAERPLTPLQQAYLMGRGRHLPLGGVAMQDVREYRGRIVPDALRRRLADLVRRHDALRTHIDADRLVQRVAPDAVLNLEDLDLRGLSPGEAAQRIDALREHVAHRLCDLSRPPWHLVLIHLPAGAADSHVLFARFDALILDGQGIATVLTHLLAERTPPAPAASSEPSPANPGDREADAAYWAAALEPFGGPTRMPWRRPLDSIAVSRYRRESLVVARDHVAALSRLGAKHGLFRNSILSALVLDVLARWCDDDGEAVSVAVPVAGPRGGRLGNDSSFLPLLYDATRGCLEERARRVQADILEGLQHLAFSGVDLNRLLLGRGLGGPPLPVVLTNALSWPKLPADAPVRLHGGLTQTPQTAMDIRLTLDERDNLVLCIDYAEEALDPALVRDLLHAMGRGLEKVARSGVLDLQAADVLDLAHYRHNGGEEDFVCSGFLQRLAQNLFETRADKAALICGEERISYGRLGRDVAALMRGLRQHGLGRGKVVAIYLPRGPEAIAVTLACALLGIVWVPVNAGTPPDRLRPLLDTCRPDLVVGRAVVDGLEMVAPQVLAQSAPEDGPAKGGPVDVRSLAALSRSDAPAYYLFTSGTTGAPKCVVLSNRATSNVIGHTQQVWQVGPRDVFLSVTPLHHDMAVFDLFGALSAGATLVVPSPGEEKDAMAWNRLVRRHGVTLWCSVPAILEMLLACRRGDDLRSLRLIAQGGDYIKPATVAALRALLPGRRLFSLGGPTETTIWSIWHELTAADVAVVPYGRPLPGSRYFVLNAAGAHCPAGVTGRIHTAGVSPALGYLEDGALAQTDFVTIADEHGAPTRAFRTGDLGRYREDGTLLFAGRVAGYVKVRGIRVSLPDIETELAGHEAIERLLVVDYGDARQGDVALGMLYVGRHIPAAELRDFARRRLPDSHVPSRFLRVPDLPLSANGKPDRGRARTLLLDGTGAPAAAPARGQRILDIYLEALGKPRSGDLDEETAFFDLGLLPSHLRTVAASLRQAFGIDLSPGRLARCRNARQVEALLQDAA